MAIKTQGTQLYFVHPATQDVINVGCITSIENVGAPIQARDVTPVESEQDVSEPGMFSPGQIDMTVLFDPSTPSHIDVYKLYKSRAIINFAIGLGDGNDDPVIDSGGEFVGVFGRSFLTFRGWVMDVPFSFPVNENLPATISIVQVPSLIDGVYGVGLLPAGGGESLIFTTTPYPVDGSESFGSEFSGVRVSPNYVLFDDVSGSFISVSGELRDIFQEYYHPDPESVSSDFLRMSGYLRTIYREYYHPGDELIFDSLVGVSGSLSEILIRYRDYSPGEIGSEFVSVEGSLS